MAHACLILKKRKKRKRGAFHVDCKEEEGENGAEGSPVFSDSVGQQELDQSMS